MNISFAAEPVFYISGFAITNSVLTSVLLYAGLISFALYFSTRKVVLLPKPRSLQNIMELVVEGLLGLFKSAAGDKAVQFFSLAGTFFLFILLGNWMGLLPGFGTVGIWETHNGERVLVPILRGVTADINTTLALSLISVGSLQYYGIKTLGARYLNKFFTIKSPIYSFVGILELISEISRIISFAFRLFGNVFAGEVLLTVIAGITSFTSGVASLPFIGLEIFVGFIQALVFVMLTLVLLKLATESHH